MQPIGQPCTMARLQLCTREICRHGAGQAKPSHSAQLSDLIVCFVAESKFCLDTDSNQPESAATEYKQHRSRARNVRRRFGQSHSWPKLFRILFGCLSGAEPLSVPLSFGDLGFRQPQLASPARTLAAGTNELVEAGSRVSSIASVGRRAWRTGSPLRLD